MMNKLCFHGCAMWLAVVTLCTTAAVGDELDEALAALRGVGPKGAGHRAAIEAWPTVARADAEQLPRVLAAMDEDAPLAENWLRAAVETIADRQLRRNGSLPLAKLKAFLRETTHAPRARRLAYELIVRVEPNASERLIPQMLDDPSLELRRDAVARVMAEAAAAMERWKKAADNSSEKEEAARQAIAIYRKALAAARDLDQVEACSKALEELGEPVDMPRHLGFILEWHLIGPFDNRGGRGFAAVYPPERAVDFDAEHEGKLGPVRWIAHRTEDRYGQVDLNKALGTHKGAVAYAVAIFNSPREQPAQLRVGSLNANQAWVNGEHVMGHESYHTGTRIDQYAADIALRKGRNIILLKICQNEQQESWAAAWQFQARLTDKLGAALHSSDRQEP